MMKEKLIDLYRFMVHPLALGTGARLFTADIKRELELSDIKRFSKGIVVLEYVPAK